MRTAMYRREELATYQPEVERLVATGLLVISLVGTVLFGGGGVAAWMSGQGNPFTAVAAVLFQVVCTWVQWVYAKERWRSRWWLVAFGISTSMTISGYWPLSHPYLTDLLIWLSIPWSAAPYWASLLIVLLAAVADFLPEQILTD